MSLGVAHRGYERILLEATAASVPRKLPLILAAVQKTACLMEYQKVQKTRPN